MLAGGRQVGGGDGAVGDCAEPTLMTAITAVVPTAALVHATTRARVSKRRRGREGAKTSCARRGRGLKC